MDGTLFPPAFAPALRARGFAAAAQKKAVEVEVTVKKVEGPIEEPKTEEEKKIFPILDAMGIEHVALACACEV